ncbi:hypothetical protein [Nissabacter sp. SGAir0207]|uniref:hypothetical protein n=1 Tax=Nissabacter sp. SGAir0207 TaxID=2126321 RepID=UPI0010CD37F9|nr:hypothetical protein [Nissabacter sp. SGAir0207]QCR36392.1 hypothetical protein C1N62_09930 [Nissabacter sp. SGAir0207]
MENHASLEELTARIEALEQREQSLTYASHAYQAIITTLLGSIDKPTRDKVIALVEQAHEIAFNRAVNQANTKQTTLIKGADEVAQRMFIFAQRDRRDPD